MPLSQRTSNSRNYCHYWAVEMRERRTYAGDPLIPKRMAVHQELFKIVSSKEEIFRELNLFWTFIDYVNTPLVLREIDIQTPVEWNSNHATVVPLSQAVWTFVYRTTCGSFINQEVSIVRLIRW